MDKKFLLTGLAAMLAMQTYAQDTPTSVEMVTVQGGSFYMGNNYMENAALSDEAPEHKVEINSFKMSKTEVTFDLFDLFCDATGWKKPKDASGRRGKIAVYNVSWEAAVMFCNWLSRCERLDQYYDIQRDSASFRVTCNESAKGYRLPTEAEWEYAARGRDQNEFPWDNPSVKSGDGCFFANFKPDRGNYTKDGNLITSKVGIYSANSNGLFDMAGNVAEWTSTIFTEAGVDAMNDLNPQLEYKAAKEDPYRLKKKSVRGGSWKDPESYIRSAWRTWEYQNQPRSYIGFRCVRSLANTTSTKQKQTKSKRK